jgi:molybdate transport system regulatory protein
MGRTLTRTELCALLRVSPKSLYLWERARKIPKPSRDRRGWRAYSPRDVEAIRRFTEGPAFAAGRASPAAARRASPAAARHAPRARTALRPRPAAVATPPVAGLSARNQLRGRVTTIRGDGVLCEVTIQLGDGQEVVAVVTKRSVERLGLAVGRDAIAIIKSTEVMLHS